MCARPIVRHLLVLVLLLLGPLAARALGQGEPVPTRDDRLASQRATKPLRVVVSIPPLRGLVEPMLQSAGVKAEVDVLIPPGVSEHGYEIPPTRLANLSRADLVVLVGLGLEPQIERMLKDRPRANRRTVIAGEAAGIAFDPNDHAHHEHGPNGECLGHAVDPHVWLDPALTEKIVSKIAEELRAWAGQDAELARRIWISEEQMLSRVKQIDERYRTTLAPATRRTLIVGHDAWGYLARRYNLTTVAIKDLTASEPTPKSIAAAARAVREHGVTTVFVEPQLSRAAGERIAQTAGVEVGLLDPLGSGDWFAMMESNLERIAAALGVTYAKP